MLKVSGPAFVGVDNRIVSLQLVERQPPRAMFTARRRRAASESALQEANLGRARQLSPGHEVTLDLLERARERFVLEPEVRGVEPVVLAEMTLNNLRQRTRISPGRRTSGPCGDPARRVRRARLALRPFYQLADYLSAYSDRLIGIALGVDR
jgi:hypothetical protein